MTNETNERTNNEGITNGVDRLIAGIHELTRLATALLQAAGTLMINTFHYLVPAVAPLSPALLLALNVYTGLTGEPEWLRRLVAGTFAFGLEGAGILASKAAAKFFYRWRDDPAQRAPFIFSLTIAGLYLLTGLIMTWSLKNVAANLKALGVGGFVVVSLVYAAAAVWGETERIDGRLARRETEAELAARRGIEEQAAEARRSAEFSREQAVRQQALDAELARLRVTTNAEIRKAAKVSAQIPAQIRLSERASERPDAEWPTDWRLLDDGRKRQLKGLSSAEIQEIAGCSSSTARRWRREVAQLNGHLSGD